MRYKIGEDVYENSLANDFYYREGHHLETEFSLSKAQVQRFIDQGVAIPVKEPRLAKIAIEFNDSGEYCWEFGSHLSIQFALAKCLNGSSDDMSNLSETKWEVSFKERLP